MRGEQIVKSRSADAVICRRVGGSASASIFILAKPRIKIGRDGGI
jgi:hypothetical protein